MLEQSSSGTRLRGPLVGAVQRKLGVGAVRRHLVPKVQALLGVALALVRRIQCLLGQRRVASAGRTERPSIGR